MRYGTSKAPDSQEWFELDEPERLDLVIRYHIGAKLPIGENEKYRSARSRIHRPSRND